MRVVMDFFRVLSLLARMSRHIRYSRSTVFLVVTAGIISGISNTILIAVINSALNRPGASKGGLILAFASLCLVLTITRFVSGALLVRLMEKAVYELRNQLCHQILAAPLRLLEELGMHRLFAALTGDVPRITEALITLPLLSMNVAIMLGCLAYLGYLSPTLLLGVLFFMALGVISHQLPVMQATKHFGRARENMDTLFKHLRALTAGVKELKLHQERRQDFFSKMLEPSAQAVARETIIGNTIWSAAGSWGQILFFISVGMIIFLVPSLEPTSTETLTGYTLTILYMMGPLEYILNTLPNLGRADVAMKKIEALGISLAGNSVSDEVATRSVTAPPWNLLELSAVTHSYDREGEDADFILGPIDLSFRPGEFVFLTGGNGSGKTTLAKLVTGLYAPESGEIRLDGKAITNENRDYYRQYFSVVFSDFYLFESLLGINVANLDDQAREYLLQLQLNHKVRVKDGVLSTTDLSQGQRKRLTLLTAYLEDRPIYVFDEWAADQDPQFKDIFYYNLLPELKARGKTVLVISHDDRYYHVADRMIKLDYGKVEQDRRLSDSEVTRAGAPLVARG